MIPIRVMARNVATEETREYDFPEMLDRFAADLVWLIAELPESRPIEAGFFRGQLQTAMEGTVSGYVGEYLEIRIIPREGEPCTRKT